jgi:hypothetical protein
MDVGIQAVMNLQVLFHSILRSKTNASIFQVFFFSPHKVEEVYWTHERLLKTSENIFFVT